jgi:GMP synthase-like glutamine amidotransferase
LKRDDNHPMTDKGIKIAILDNSINPAVYKPVEHWRQFLSQQTEAFTAREWEFPDLSKGYTHLIITGSEASILEREPWVYIEVEVLREAVDRGLSILGSCYGHQLLALSLFGPDRVARCRKPELGWSSILFEPNPLISDGGRMDIFTSHFDEVVNLPDDCLVFASTPDCAVQAFQLRDRPVWGIQPHPEISIARGKRFFEAIIATGARNSDLFQTALASTPKDSGLIHSLVANFLGTMT